MVVALTTHPIQYQAPLWRALAREKGFSFQVWYLTRHGVESSYDTEFGRSFAWDFDTLQGYDHLFLEVAPGARPDRFWNCRLRERLRERLQQSNVEVLWIQGWQVLGYWQAAYEARAAGVEVWLRGESNDLAPIKPWKEGVKRLVLGKLFKGVDKFFYIGSANHRFYQKYGISAGRLSSAPYSVDRAKFTDRAESQRVNRAELRQRWGVSAESFCVLFCGKFIKKKRPFDVVAAARLWLMNETRQNLHLLFVGSGPLEAKLRSDCRVMSGEEGRVGDSSSMDQTRPRASFTGFLNQAEVVLPYVAADCLVLPSNFGETWGLVVNEAMACGLPCIVSDACGCAEDLVGKLHRELVYPCGDIKALAEALVWCSNHAIQQERLEEIVQKHDLKYTCDAVREAYRPKS